ncbi:Fc receptor-like protein 5 [Archocentrus centrarchus]|uniref:Fc receptor-like protein 5 n=1 Tax=Archocentrus centrarchus TaxID=63155 RepID=UPI0011EA4D0F|nr:Fc receptor-like protein 5 [Archocentrus centrarchus]
MGPTLLCELGLFLLCTLLCTGHTQDAVLTIEPNWSSFFIGEFVTFVCDMNEGADTDWYYKLYKDGRDVVLYKTYKDYRLPITYAGDSGEYQCFGRRKSSNYTKSSNTVSVTVSDKPRATLTAGTTIIPVGGSVTLTCSVGRSAEWKYEWFRRTQRTTEVPNRRDDQPNRVIRVSQGGIYRCRGGRGNPVYYTDKSDEVSIEITFSNKVAVKQQQHNWPQIFSGETITLTCEVQEGGEPTEWEYGWRGPRQTTQWTHNNSLTFRVSESSSGDYMCKSRRRDDSYSSTEWSEAFTLSVTTGKPRATLTAGTTIIPVGGIVTLTCSVGSSAEWKYEWFRRTQTTTEVQIRRDDQPNRVIRVSQGGIYRCRGRRGNPVFYTDISDEVSIEITFSNKVAVKQQQHNWTQIFSGETITLTCEVQEGGEPTEWEYQWKVHNQTTQWTHNNYLTFRVSESSSGDYMCKSRHRDDSYSSTEWSEAFTLSATTAPGAESSSFFAPLIVGLVCGVLLIFLLLLLRHFKKSKDSHLIRTRSTNQSSATNHMINQDEAQRSRHTSPLQDDSMLYAQVSYNKAKAKRAKEKSAPAAAEETLYSEVKLHTALDDSLLYAQVSYNKAKAKRSKGKSAPAAADETVYAEVKPQTAVGACTEIIL